MCRTLLTECGRQQALRHLRRCVLMQYLCYQVREMWEGVSTMHDTGGDKGLTSPSLRPSGIESWTHQQCQRWSRQSDQYCESSKGQQI